MTQFPTYLLLPFFAALIFATSSLCFKRAFVEGVSPARSLVQTNVALGLIFLPFFQFDSHRFVPAMMGWPMLAGTLFFVGQCCNFAALRFGDVSLVTPIMGSKVVLVALCSRWVFDFPLTRAHWVAAGLTSLGVFVLGATDLRKGRRLSLSLATALGSSMCFALVDTVIQRGSRDFGSFNSLSVLFATLAVLSAALWPWLGRGQPPAPIKARGWLIAATGLTAAQGLLITLSIGIWQDATGVNVVYSLRGVWGVALIGMVGPWFGNTERHEAGTRILGVRFIGAGLILLAVVLTFMQPGQPK